MNIQRVSLVQTGGSIDANHAPATTDCTAGISLLEQAASGSTLSTVSKYTMFPHSNIRNGKSLSVPSRENSRSATYIRLETSPINQRCQHRCPCQCHVPYEASSPRWLQGLLGTAFVRTSGFPLFGRRTCNFWRCVSNTTRSGSLSVQYRFPTWFLQLAVETTATWRSLNGINGTWTLKVPRTIDDSFVYSQVIRCIRLGNSVDLLKLMARNGIRPYDIFTDVRQDPLTVLTASTPPP